MTAFGEKYSKYYNLLYQNKNYLEEYNYICEIIKKHGKTHDKNILDIGCGTGKHLKYFKKDGFSVSGVDISESMINEAKKYLKQDHDLICCNASEFSFDNKFDIILSLFHVMSYQTKNNDLENIFQNVSNHLTDGGLFIFDFWYGPAVLSDPPTIRIKRLEDANTFITRITEPVMNINNNIVDVNFEVILESKKTHFTEKINETHKMRYLFIPEIEYFSKKTGLTIIATYNWLDFSSLSEKTWYGLIILSNEK